MKKIFTLILATLLSFGAYSQTDTIVKDTTKHEMVSIKDSIINSLPSYYVVNGDTVGIILTIEQAQKLDNDEELLDLLEEMKISCDSTIKHYIIVVNKYERKVATLEIKAKKLEEVRDGQKKMIDNLNQQILNYQTDLKKAEDQLKLKDEIIKNDEQMISNLNKWKYGGLTGTLIGFGLFLLHVATHH
jgi:uncharacterized coiled-coil protein SlyX